MTAPPLPAGLSTRLFEMPLGVIAHAAREAIVVVDRQQSIVAMNPAAQRMFRVVGGEALGQPLSILIPPVARVAHESHLRRFDASGVVERPMAERGAITGLRADGQEFPAEATISRIELAIDGRTRTFFVALMRDLSQERALQDEVEALTRRFRTLLDMTPVAMWICEGDHVAFANRAALDLVGLGSGEQLVGRSVCSLLHPDSHDALREQVQRAFAGEAAPAVVTGAILRFDGQTREVEIASAALPDHGRTVVQMVITDITQRQRQEREQARHRRELRQLSASVVQAREEERRRIARELHDELGQRLTALKMELSSLGPAAQASHEVRVTGMLEMIDDTVAAVRRIAADLRPMMLDDLGLNAAIEWLARDAARRMDIAITVRLGEEDPPVTDGAAIALYRMVQEALTNVARHAHATDVGIEMRQEGGELVLTVRDNGVGFSDRSLQHDGRYGLLGIRERAYMLGGRLEVDNPPGGGGRLTVRLPLAAADADAAVDSPPRTP
jgi:PAS domain S-box-containing protein